MTTVPGPLRHTPSFQQWLAAQEKTGNQLRHGHLEWVFRVGDTVLWWAFHADLWIAAEQRVKSEVVLSRPDLCTIVAYHPAGDLGDCEVVLVREARASATTIDGFVRELPGGSGSPLVAPREQAIAELAEETGITVTSDRVRAHQSRQLAATTSAHRQHVFSVVLTADELHQAVADDQAHGVSDDSEQTYVEVHRYADLLARPLVDWSTLGAITHVLHVDREADA